jgi:predicted DNA-binding transcriptional regulator YafY
MKINRLLEIVTILLNRETITAKELAGRFEVSSRTIYRDIDALSSAGVPVYTNKGNGGGISLLEDYTLNKTLLSKIESEGLLLALKIISATSYPEANAIIDKLGSIYKNNRARDWIDVDFEGWNVNVNEQNKFAKIRESIFNSKIISFDYVNANGGKSNRSVEPVRLYFINYTWYLVAYCLLRNSCRMFRLSRIRNVQITERHFAKRELIEDESRITDVPLVELRLRCEEKVLNRLYDSFGDENVYDNGDGSYDLTILLPEDEWLYGYILSLGGSAEVFKPDHIREIIKTRAKEILEKY